jgi:Dolichyl-phosphate-mannose-protein mannosyltransferase
MLIPLVLTSFTHLWNLGEFPLFHADEGTYMRRILLVSNGTGIHEKTGFYANAYNNPFFGQILLGSLLRLTGFPNFAMDHTTSSIELAMAFPRMIMGVFSIIDTFLLFKICQRAYNIRIAFFASILFAVMPMTWLMRMITLDTIALPLILASILVSLSLRAWNKTWNLHRHIFLVLLSGTLLGLAILTKIPFFTMIPLVAYLIYKNSNHVKGKLPLNITAIWLIPVLLIPSIWPLYAISVNEFDFFKKGLSIQTSKDDRRSQVMAILFNIDSMLFFLGLAGLVYSFVKKDWIVVLWIVPFLTFVYIHGWFHFLHGVILLPGLCIGGSKFVIELTQKIKSHKIKKLMDLMIICTIISIGFFNTFNIVNQNLQASAIEVMSEGLDYSDKADGLDDNKINENNITVIAPTEYSWIYKYIHKMNYAFDTQMDIGPRKIETNKTVILQKHAIGNAFDELKNKFSAFVLGLSKLRKICYIDIEWYKTDKTHPQLIIKPFEHYTAQNDIVFHVDGNYDPNNPERIDMKNTTARYVNITLLPNTQNTNGAITELVIYGKKDDNGDCKRIPIKTVKFKDHSLLFNALENYDIIASYKKLLHDMKVVTKYDDQHLELNYFTKLFSPRAFDPMTLQLKANY